MVVSTFFVAKRPVKAHDESIEKKSDADKSLESIKTPAGVAPTPKKQTKKGILLENIEGSESLSTSIFERMLIFLNNCGSGFLVLSVAFQGGQRMNVREGFPL